MIKKIPGETAEVFPGIFVPRDWKNLVHIMRLLQISTVLYSKLHKNVH